MRGVQRACSAELEVEYDYLTYSVVLASLTVFAALSVLSVFVLDWFSGALPRGGLVSIDLWSVAECDSNVGCWSRPFEKAAVGTYRWFAAITLWLTALSSVAVFVQAGRYLAGRTPWRPLTSLGHVLCLATIASAIVTTCEPPAHYASAAPVSAAPFLLVLACMTGMFAMHAATKWARLVVRPLSGIPHARVVR